MPRLLFTIAANDKGWQLYEGQYGRNWFDNLGDARESAKLLAAKLDLGEMTEFIHADSLGFGRAHAAPRGRGRIRIGGMAAL